MLLRKRGRERERGRGRSEQKNERRMGVGVIMDDTSEYKKSKKLKEAEFP
jgi:hypothetical protein